MNRSFILNQRLGKVFLLHSQVWLLLFILNYIFTRSYEIKYDIRHQLFAGLLYLTLFYLNYSFLMPNFFFRKKITLYIIISLLVVLSGSYIKREIEFSRMQKVIESEWGFNQVDSLGEYRMFGKRHFFIERETGTPPPELSQDYRDFHPPLKKPPFRFDFMSFYSVLLIYIGSITLRFISKWQDDEKRKSEIEKENIATELSFLKQQINPHFLFNSLNSIYSLTITKSDKAVDSILKLSSILRYMLYESGTSQVRLHDELQIINDYIELQKLRITDKVNLIYKVEGNSASFKIEPFILVPLIENAFKYGVDNYNNSTIEIYVSIQDNKLRLIVRNSVVKRLDPFKSESGIGIKNIRRRLDLLYPNEYSFDIDETDNIFTIKLEIDLKE